ncbi:MAG: carbon storage regulator [Thermoguttaceae bacterium]|nr:carbon storage regulator [Thermoguttaceae bacterium]
MLVVSRRNGESVFVGDNVRITIVEIKGARIRLGVEADKTRRVMREEILPAVSKIASSKSGDRVLPKAA